MPKLPEKKSTSLFPSKERDKSIGNVLGVRILNKEATPSAHPAHNESNRKTSPDISKEAEAEKYLHLLDLLEDETQQKSSSASVQPHHPRSAEAKTVTNSGIRKAEKDLAEDVHSLSEKGPRTALKHRWEGKIASENETTGEEAEACSEMETEEESTRSEEAVEDPFNVTDFYSVCELLLEAEAEKPFFSCEPAGVVSESAVDHCPHTVFIQSDQTFLFEGDESQQLLEEYQIDHGNFLNVNYLHYFNPNRTQMQYLKPYIPKDRRHGEDGRASRSNKVSREEGGRSRQTSGRTFSRDAPLHEKGASSDGPKDMGGLFDLLEYQPVKRQAGSQQRRNAARNKHEGSKSPGERRKSFEEAGYTGHVHQANRSKEMSEGGVRGAEIPVTDRLGYHNRWLVQGKEEIFSRSKMIFLFKSGLIDLDTPISIDGKEFTSLEKRNAQGGILIDSFKNLKKYLYERKFYKDLGY